MKNLTKYPNRRLYDLEESRYTTYREVTRAVLKGAQIAVASHPKQRDITNRTLGDLIAHHPALRGSNPVVRRKLFQTLRALPR